MRRARFAFAAFAAASILAGCTLLVGTDTRTVGDTDAQPDDATTLDVATDAITNDGNVTDAPADAAIDGPCDITGCIAEAGTCNEDCVDADTTCRQACSGNPCKKACDQTETTCFNACVVNCAVCTTVAGCTNQDLCSDAGADL